MPMNGYQQAARKLINRLDYNPKHLRSLKHMFNLAIEDGTLGKRPEGWLETVIFLGYGITLVDARDRVIGFTVVRPLGVNQAGQPIVYGETSLWRGRESWNDVRFALVDGARSWGAHEIWGAYFKTNVTAREFFMDYERIDFASLPDTVKNELGRYSPEDIEYIRLEV